MAETKISGVVIKSTGSWYNVVSNKTVYNCKIRGKLRTSGFDSTNPVAVGDIVTFTLEKDGVGVIIDIEERKNCVVRQSVNLSKRVHILACNIDQVIILVSLQSPETPIEFIDRFLVSAESYQIPAIVVFNKIDIYSDEQINVMRDLIDVYEKIGYKCIPVSATEEINLEVLKKEMKDKTSVIAGNSGVGKSTLINIISPNLNLKVSEVSDKHKTGKHTTTFAEMFELCFGGYIIDTPGIRAFGTSFIEKEYISHNFPEMFELLENCKYYNCTHIDEPECAVKEAVEAGNVAVSRYKSYVNIMLEEAGKYRKDDYE